jgi:hypothetical protein
MAETVADAGTNVAATKDSTNTRWNWITSTLGLILMGLATIGSSWCGYQSNLWEGIQTFKLTDAAAFSRDADESAIRATQQRAVDAALFVEYARDMYDRKTELSAFILARMRPELQKAINAWVLTRPSENPNAPSSPFVMPEYQVKADADAAELNARSTSAHDKAQEANKTGDTYTLLTVLYATVLFLAGLVSTIDERRARLVTLIMGGVVFIAASLVLLHLPVAQIG